MAQVNWKDVYMLNCSYIIVRMKAVIMRVRLRME